MPHWRTGDEPPGELIPGNIDLNNRPIVKNDDGTYSTVRSITVTTDAGHAVLIPTVINGKVVSNDEAIASWQKTGQNLGTFVDETSADNYAEVLHTQQAAQYDQQAADAGAAAGATGETPTSPMTLGDSIKPDANDTQQITAGQAEVRLALAVGLNYGQLFSDGPPSTVQTYDNPVDKALSGGLDQVTKGLGTLGGKLGSEMLGTDDPTDPQGQLVQNRTAAGKAIAAAAAILPQTALYGSVIDKLDPGQLLTYVANNNPDPTVAAAAKALVNQYNTAHVAKISDIATNAAAGAVVTSDVIAKAQQEWLDSQSSTTLNPNLDTKYAQDVITGSSAAGQATLTDNLDGGSVLGFTPSAQQTTPPMTYQDLQALYRQGSSEAGLNAGWNNAAPSGSNQVMIPNDIVKIPVNKTWWGMPTTYTVTETVNMPYTMTADQIRAVNDKLQRAGYYDKPSDPSDRTGPADPTSPDDPQFRTAWRDAVAGSIRAGVGVIALLQTKAKDLADSGAINPDGTWALTDQEKRSLEKQKESDQADIDSKKRQADADAKQKQAEFDAAHPRPQESDPMTIAEHAQAAANKVLHHDLTGDQLTDLVSYIHGLEDKTTTDRVTTSGAQPLVDLDQDARINNWINMMMPPDVNKNSKFDKGDVWTPETLTQKLMYGSANEFSTAKPPELSQVGETPQGLNPQAVNATAGATA